MLASLGNEFGDIPPNKDGWSPADIEFVELATCVRGELVGGAERS